MVLTTSASPDILKDYRIQIQLSKSVTQRGGLTVSEVTLQCRSGFRLSLQLLLDYHWQWIHLKQGLSPCIRKHYCILSMLHFQLSPYTNKMTSALKCSGSFNSQEVRVSNSVWRQGIHCRFWWCNNPWLREMLTSHVLSPVPTCLHCPQWSLFVNSITYHAIYDMKHLLRKVQIVCFTLYESAFLCLRM